eukprot:Pgem_evm1s8031
MSAMSLAILQPFNALIRPKPAENDGGFGLPSVKRFIWECLHKCTGYLALVLAFMAIALGIGLLPKAEDQQNFIIGLVLIGGFFLSLIIYLAYESYTLKKRNPHHPLQVNSTLSNTSVPLKTVPT